MSIRGSAFEISSVFFWLALNLSYNLVIVYYHRFSRRAFWALFQNARLALARKNVSSVEIGSFFGHWAEQTNDV